MVRSAHMRKTMLVLAVVIAIVAVVVPTCRMVGCAMEMGSVDMLHHGLSFTSHCGGQYVMNATPDAVVAAGSDALTLAIVAAVFAALMFARPREAFQPVRFIDATPPPPPEDPRGERLRI
ncbi:MAG: hypothetical protein FDZ75_07455 [Actinobacteria bacterium]|nr:MAG: hypothetical protein FDZ75_07455 [Actinomycetota bacterium]